MKIHIKRIAGVKFMHDDWSISADYDTLKDFYMNNKKKFVIGYQFTVQNITYEVTNFSNKASTHIEFKTDYYE